MHHAGCMPAEVFDTYTYSDVGFEGDACPPCIVIQPPVATLHTWMDAQDPTNLVWEEQVCFSSTVMSCCFTPLMFVITTARSSLLNAADVCHHYCPFLMLLTLVPLSQ